MCLKRKLFYPKNKKSPIRSKFEIFYHVPNLTTNFETHKNVGDNFYFVYK